MQFGTNHLGHFLLTNYLIPALKRGADSNGGARIVNVSSIGHFMARSGIPFEDLKGEKHYEKWHRYGVSKLANILHAMELNRRLTGTGITAYSLHPGVIATNLMRHQSGFLEKLQHLLSGRFSFQKTIPQGAATTLYCALAPNIDTPETGAGGFFADCNLETFYRSKNSTNQAAAEKLWEVSANLTMSNISL
jgi:NAD(P)-dependent dehydrogenase (short-subunit alcohol dehydrogenase family)